MEEKNKKSGLSTAGMVLGIIAICTSFIPFINNLSFIMAILALIFGIIGVVKKSGTGKAIAAIILSILAGIFTISAQNSLSNSLNQTFDEINKNVDKAVGNSTEEILKNDADITLGNLEINKDEYGLTDTKLNVKVTNKTSEKKSFSIHIEAVDSTGARIEDDYVYANDLASGQTQEFKTFTLISSDKIETMENASFKIVDVSMF